MLLHAIDVGSLNVDLVNRYDDGVVGLFSKFECFFSLWLEGIVGDHEDRNISYISSALCIIEKAWPRRIDKGDLLAFVINLVSADVLSDPAGFTFDYIGFADGIEQSGLTVVDVAEDAHHRGTRLKKLGVIVVGLFNLWLRGAAFFVLFATVMDLLTRNHAGLRLAPRRSPRWFGSSMQKYHLHKLGN